MKLLSYINDSSIDCCADCFTLLLSEGSRPESLGAINGLSQTAGAVSRTMGPTTAGVLLTLSLQKQYLGKKSFLFLTLTVLNFDRWELRILCFIRNCIIWSIHLRIYSPINTCTRFFLIRLILSSPALLGNIYVIYVIVIYVFTPL